MSYQNIKRSKVKCRKSHKCESCGIEIKVGEEVIYDVAIDEGGFRGVYICLYCDDLIDELQTARYLEGEFYFDKIADSAKNYFCYNCKHNILLNHEFGTIRKCAKEARLKHCRCEHFEKANETRACNLY
jgi:hypothetical protein